MKKCYVVTVKRLSYRWSAVLSLALVAWLWLAAVHFHADASTSAQRDIGKLDLPDEADDTRTRHHVIPRKRYEGCGDMDVDDAKTVALHGIGGREGEPPYDAPEKQATGKDAQPREPLAADPVEPTGRTQFMQERPHA